ncbi:Spc97/Spc98 [Penicillium expansum]|uniref:Spindle pole body component n=1 Tax=Penicillium expansum TaxID=27334 RepID=A0A0A2JFW2_PENEN|nr:Spc97/Spc98 [Penicillium expansum]KGO46585.1 Spc97/Spc98 [Penicillium expansum]KGO53578.1 Spc97/Spc98 [Penicillium expansum]KGO65886.1 Spc97/Spc98 [Penicillium expansum]
MDCDHELDPFSSESLWRLSKFSIEALQPLGSLPWNTTLSDDATSCFEVYPQPADNIDPVWKLDLFPTGLEKPESSTDSIINPSIDGESDTTCDSLREISGDDNDIWALDLLQEDPAQLPPQKSWERYQHRSFQEPVSVYFSESGAKGFDAALSKQNAAKRYGVPNRMVRTDVFIRSLLCLGLGWSSAFFHYNPHTNQFERHLKDIRVSGISSLALENVIESVVQCGTNMQRMRMFAQDPPAKCKELSALFTLSSTVAVILFNLEQQISDHSKNVASLLQIKALFHRCGDLIGVLAGIVGAAQKAASDAQAMSIITERAAFFAQKFDWIENLVHEIVIRVTRPWFKFIETWIGLRPEDTALKASMASGKTFVRLDTHGAVKFKTGPPRIDHIYQADHMPSFIPTDQARSIFESGRSLQLLKRSHPQHPIARRDVLLQTGGLHLHCATTWADIEKIQTKAQEYESSLRAEIKRYHKGDSGLQDSPSNVGTQGVDQTVDTKVTTAAFELFDIDDEKKASGPVKDHRALSKDDFKQLLDKARGFEIGSTNEGTNLGPELTSGLHLSLAPILSSQALLIDYSCLHLLFKEHRIRHHLNMQWRFQLLGEGSFVARLSNSLFDPEMESGERKAGKVRSGVDTGLRLGSRDTWPPASSELRLVLIGLLGDCYFGSKNAEDDEKTHLQKDNQLPGGLSFGIRELTDEEIEACKNPNAVEALDFLRLQYTPPEVLESLITTRSLNKYDRLFKHLLRLIRMVSVVKGLIRDSTARGSLSGDTHNVYQRFRVDAQHFVLAVSDYCFHIGIGSIWQRFQDTLTKIEHCLNRGDIDGTIEAAHSVPRLRDYHEDMLDQMLFALFLSKRHAQAAKLLESIFGTVLGFSLLSRADGIGMRNESEGAVLHLYQSFRKQTSAFVNYLRSLESGKATSKSMARSGGFFSSRTDPTSVFEHLRVRLDMKNYY